jgi:hypothetical protein
MSLSILHRPRLGPCNSQEISCMDTRWTICTTTLRKQYDTPNTFSSLLSPPTPDPRWIDNMHNSQHIPQNGRTLDICPRPHFPISIHRCTPRSRSLHSRPEYSPNTMHRVPKSMTWFRTTRRWSSSSPGYGQAVRRRCSNPGSCPSNHGQQRSEMIIA